MTDQERETLDREIMNVKWVLERHHQGMRFKWPWRSIDGAYWDWRAEKALDDLYDDGGGE